MKKNLLGIASVAVLSVGIAALPTEAFASSAATGKGAAKIEAFDKVVSIDAPAKGPKKANADAIVPADVEWFACYQGDDLTCVNVEWSPVTTDSKGNPLPEGTEVYYLFASSMADFGNKVTTTPGATSAQLVTYPDGTSPEASIERFGIWALIYFTNDEGEEDFETSPNPNLSPLVPMGELCTVPYEESWPDGKHATNAGFERLAGESYIFSIHDNIDSGNVSDGWESVDGDQGLIGNYPWTVGVKNRYCFSCIKVDENADDPNFSFYYTNDIIGNWIIDDDFADDDEITFEIYANGDLAYTETFVVEGTVGWKKYSVNVEGLQGKTIVPMITFYNPTKYNHYTFVDKFRVEYSGGNNLSLSNFDAPASVFLGEDFYIGYTIKNTGGNDASGYTLALYRNGEILETARKLPTLKAGQETSGRFLDAIYDNSVLDYTYELVLNWKDDENMRDNSATINVKLDLQLYPEVTVVNTEKVGATVVVTWEEPGKSGPAKVIAGNGNHSEIQGYHVYRNGTQLTPAPLNSYIYVDEHPVVGENVYTVSAVYTSGGEVEQSEATSEPVTFTDDELVTGISTVSVAGAANARYFNLQGIEVANPVSGNVYIVKKGNQVVKMKF